MRKLGWLPLALLVALVLASGLVSATAEDGSKAKRRGLSLRRIPAQKVKLGSSVRLWLRTTGSTGPLRYSVSPMPLPPHAQLGGGTGVFTFEPDATQSGVFDFTFSVTDGTKTVSRAVRVTVKPVAANGVTAMTGVLLDSNSIVKVGRDVAVAGARVSILGTSVSATTNRKGKFVLRGIPAGPQVFDIDASGARPGPDGARYAGFRESVTLIEHATNVKQRPFYLPRIAAASLTTIDPNATTTVANAEIGVSMTVPPHTAKAADGSDFTGQISISEVLDAVAPVAKPPGMHPALLVTIQPIGVTFATPVPITFPNRDGLPAGTQVDLYSLDPNLGKFVPVGLSVVSADGNSVVTISGGVRAADWHCEHPPPPPPPPPNVDDDDCPDCADSSAGTSLVTLFNGVVSTGFELPPGETLGRRIAPRFQWRSDRAAPFPVVSVASHIPVLSAVPKKLSYALAVGGVSVGNETYIDTSGLDESRDEPFLVASAFDASSLATGTYPVETTLACQFAISRLSTFARGTVNVVNERGSPFGSGWGLEGLQRITVSADGSALVVDGDGSSGRFRSADGSRRDILLSDGPSDRLLRYDGATGVFVGTFVDAGSGGLDQPHDPVFGPDGHVYVVSSAAGGYQNAVLRYDGRTGEFLGVFVAANSGGLGYTAMHAFGPDGHLYTSDARDGGKVRRYSGLDGSFLGIAAEGNGMRRPCGIAFGPSDGRLYVLDADPFKFTNYDRILRFDGATGAFIDVFVARGNLDDTCPFGFGPDGDLYVPDAEFRDVRRFSGTDGSYRGVFASGGPLGAQTPYMVTAGPDGFLYVTNNDLLRYDVATGRGEVFIPGAAGFPHFFPPPAAATGAFEAPAGERSRLDRPVDGSFRRTYLDGRVVVFDAAGLEVSDTDANGNARTFAYDAQRRLVRITDEVASTTTFAYGTSGLLAKVTDPFGRETTFEHDAARRLVRVALPGGAERRFGYDARHLMTSETDPAGNQKTREFDKFARWTRGTLPGGVVRSGTNSQSTSLVDPDSGLGTFSNPAPLRRPTDAVSTITDGAGGTRTHVPGPFGASASITDAVGLVFERDSTSRGDITRLAWPDGEVFRAGYDTSGNVLSLADDLVAGTAAFTYDAGTDLLRTATDPFGAKTEFSYDAAGNLTQTRTPTGLTNVFAYGAKGLVSASTNPFATVAASSYDARGNVTQVAWGSGAGQRVTSVGRTPEGFVATSTDAAGRLTSYQYDAFGRVTHTVLPGNRTITATHDATGRQASLTTPTGAAHDFDWTPFGLLARHSAPVAGADGRETTFTYDAAQRLVRTARADGRNLDRTYDLAGRLLTTVGSGGTTTYTYSATSGTLTSIASPGGVTLGFGYSGRLVTSEAMSGPVAASVTSQYDKARRRTLSQVAGTPSVSYAYDTENRMTQAGALTLTYSATTGLLTGTTLGTTTDAWTYDAFGDAVTYTASRGATTLYAVQDTRDALGRATSRTETIGGVTTTTTFAYDAAGRLATVSVGAAQTASYTYDANGNRLTRVAPGGTETGVYDARDRATSYGAATFVNAASGERTSRTDTGLTTSYAYDERGNLTRVDLASAVRIDHLIDGRDRRLGRLVAGVLDRGFVWDSAVGSPRLVAELDASGAVRSVFVHGRPRGAPSHMLRGGATYRIVSDPLGSPRLVVDAATGAVAQRMDYDESGRVTLDTNPGFQPFGFAGGLYDPVTGLVCFGSREYDPATGRFTTPDPLLFADGDVNLFAYAAGDPVNATVDGGTRTRALPNSMPVTPPTRPALMPSGRDDRRPTTGMPSDGGEASRGVGPGRAPGEH